MAPEQAVDAKTADQRADIYALGCTLFRLITGNLPYRGDNPMQTVVAHREQPIPSMQIDGRKAPKPLQQIIEGMLAKKPEDRYDSAQAVIEDLLAVVPAARNATIRLHEEEQSSADVNLPGSSTLDKLAGAVSKVSAASAAANSTGPSRAIPVAMPAPKKHKSVWKSPAFVGGAMLTVAAIGITAFLFSGSKTVAPTAPATPAKTVAQPAAAPAAPKPLPNAARPNVTPAGWTDLLNRRDLQLNFFKRTADGLEFTASGMSAVQLPGQWSGDYDIRIVAQRTASASVGLLLPVGDHMCAVLGDGPQFSGWFEMIDGKARARNFTAAAECDSPTTIEARVRLNGDQAKIEVDINGANRFRWEGPIKSLALYSAWAENHRAGMAGIAARIAYGAGQVRILSAMSRVRDNPVAASANGWTTLFDGTNLDQWRSYNADKPSDKISIDKGQLRIAAQDYLVTRQSYGDFELELEWSVGPKGNGGVLFHVNPNNVQPSDTAIEVQLIDDEYPDLTPVSMTGAFFKLKPRTKNTVKPQGEWNALRLVVGHDVEVYINNELVNTLDTGAELSSILARSTDKHVNPRLGKNKTGVIALQGWGGAVRYRNIRIRPLTTSDGSPSQPTPPAPPPPVTGAPGQWTNLLKSLSFKNTPFDSSTDRDTRLKAPRMLELPTGIAGDYDLRMTVRRDNNAAEGAVAFPVADRVVTLVLNGMYGKTFGLENINGQHIGLQSVASTAAPNYEPNRDYNILVSVRTHDGRAYIDAFVDAKPMIRYHGPIEALSSSAFWPGKPGKVSVGSMPEKGIFAFRSVEFRPLAADQPAAAPAAEPLTTTTAVTPTTAAPTPPPAAQATAPVVNKPADKPGPWTNLFFKLDLRAANMREGRWQPITNGVRGVPERGPVIISPTTSVTGSYDLLLRFRAAGGQPAVLLPLPATAVLYVLRSRDETMGLDSVDGRLLPDATDITRPAILRLDRDSEVHTSVRVTGDQVLIDSQIDGKPGVKYEGAINRLGVMAPPWQLPKDRVAIGNSEAITIYAADVRRVDPAAPTTWKR
jgi:hypothetical protein